MGKRGRREFFSGVRASARRVRNVSGPVGIRILSSFRATSFAVGPHANRRTGEISFSPLKYLGIPEQTNIRPLATASFDFYTAFFGVRVLRQRRFARDTHTHTHTHRHRDTEYLAAAISLPLVAKLFQNRTNYEVIPSRGNPLIVSSLCIPIVSLD